MKPKYITPRIAVAMVSSQADLQKTQTILFLLQFDNAWDRKSEVNAVQMARTTLFNNINNQNNATGRHLSSGKLSQLCYPLRQRPDHLTICSFHRQNIHPILCTLPCQKIYQLAEKLIERYPYLSRQMSQIYRTISIDAIPVKYLQSLVIEPSDTFIPIVQIFTEGRYNDFESVYNHAIEEDLAIYYLDLNRPLATGIGRRYYDCRPQTKYFKHPIAVAGDIKIKVYSYQYLAKVHQFTLGFNTHHINELNQSNPGLLIFQQDDLYERNQENLKKITIKIQFSDYCEGKCRKQPSCQECKEFTKRLAGRYSDCQAQLQKLHRVRTKQQVSVLLSL